MKNRIEDVIAASDTIVVGNASKEFAALGSDLEGRMVVDLARTFGQKTSGGRYAGISW